MQHAPQSLQSFLRSLADGVDRSAPLRWASAIFIGSIKGDEMDLYDTSGEIAIGAKIVGVANGAVARDTVILDQLTGEPGGPGRYVLNAPQRLPKSLLGAVAT